MVFFHKHNDFRFNIKPDCSSLGYISRNMHIENHALLYIRYPC